MHVVACSASDTHWRSVSDYSEAMGSEHFTRNHHLPPPKARYLQLHAYILSVFADVIQTGDGGFHVAAVLPIDQQPGTDDDFYNRV